MIYINNTLYFNTYNMGFYTSKPKTINESVSYYHYVVHDIYNSIITEKPVTRNMSLIIRSFQNVCNHNGLWNRKDDVSTQLTCVCSIVQQYIDNNHIHTANLTSINSTTTSTST